MTAANAIKSYETKHRDCSVCALVAAAAIALLALILAPTAAADESVTSCGGYPNVVFGPDSAYGISATSTCPGGNIALDATTLYSRGQGAVWQADAPAGLEIVGAAIPPQALLSVGVNVGSTGQYGGDFYWEGGSSNIAPGETSLWVGPLASNYFGFLLVCGKPTCSGLAGPGEISIGEIVLGVHETVGPSMSASGLWQASGWVRGTWPLGFSGDSPSGLCAMYATPWGPVAARQQFVSEPVDVASVRCPGGQRFGRDRWLWPGCEDAGAERLGRGRQQRRLTAGPSTSTTSSRRSRCRARARRRQPRALST